MRRCAAIVADLQRTLRCDLARRDAGLARPHHRRDHDLLRAQGLSAKASSRNSPGAVAVFVAIIAAYRYNGSFDGDGRRAHRTRRRLGARGRAVRLRGPRVRDRHAGRLGCWDASPSCRSSGSSTRILGALLGAGKALFGAFLVLYVMLVLPDLARPARTICTARRWCSSSRNPIVPSTTRSKVCCRGFSSRSRSRSSRSIIPDRAAPCLTANVAACGRTKFGG